VSTCLPRFEVLDTQTHLSDTYTDTAAHMGCEGRLVTEVATGGQVIRTYDWGRVESGPYVQVQYWDGLIRSWTSQGLVDAAPSVCLPTRDAVARLAVGMGSPTVDTTIGCPGHGVSFSMDYKPTGGGSTLVLSWGDVTSGPYLLATFRLGRLESYITQRL
jgi:hypothetical protein